MGIVVGFFVFHIVLAFLCMTMLKRYTAKSKNPLIWDIVIFVLSLLILLSISLFIVANTIMLER